MPSTIPSPRTNVSPTVGTSSVLIIGAAPSRAGLFEFNPNATTVLAISPSDSTPVVNGVGITLQPGTGIQLDNWTNGLNAIASAPGATITVFEFYP